MMVDRKVKVTLVAETAEFEAAMDRARKATKRLEKALRKVIETRIAIRVERES